MYFLTTYVKVIIAIIPHIPISNYTPLCEVLHSVNVDDSIYVSMLLFQYKP